MCRQQRVDVGYALKMVGKPVQGRKSLTWLVKSMKGLNFRDTRHIATTISE